MMRRCDLPRPAGSQPIASRGACPVRLCPCLRRSHGQYRGCFGRVIEARGIVGVSAAVLVTLTVRLRVDERVETSYSSVEPHRVQFLLPKGLRFRRAELCHGSSSGKRFQLSLPKLAKQDHRRIRATQ